MLQRDFLMEVLLGNRDAVTLCETMFGISQIWDDLEDGDKAVSPEDISEMMMLALVGLPNNPFYRKHIIYLQPIIEMAITDWHTANRFEISGEEHGLNLAFVLRDSLTYLVIACARIISGIDYAVEVAPKVRIFFHDETLMEYKGETK